MSTRSEHGFCVIGFHLVIIFRMSLKAHPCLVCISTTEWHQSPKSIFMAWKIFCFLVSPLLSWKRISRSSSSDGTGAQTFLFDFRFIILCRTEEDVTLVLVFSSFSRVSNGDCVIAFSSHLCAHWYSYSYSYVNFCAMPCLDVHKNFSFVLLYFELRLVLSLCVEIIFLVELCPVNDSIELSRIAREIEERKQHILWVCDWRQNRMNEEICICCASSLCGSGGGDDGGCGGCLLSGYALYMMRTIFGRQMPQRRIHFHRNPRILGKRMRERTSNIWLEFNRTV